MHVADELLRDRARAAAVLAHDLSLDRAEHADDVDAVVLVEALIFDRDERLRTYAGKRLERHAGPHLVTDFADRACRRARRRATTAEAE